MRCLAKQWHLSGCQRRDSPRAEKDGADAQGLLSLRQGPCCKTASAVFRAPWLATLTLTGGHASSRICPALLSAQKPAGLSLQRGASDCFKQAFIWQPRDCLTEQTCMWQPRAHRLAGGSVGAEPQVREVGDRHRRQGSCRVLMDACSHRDVWACLLVLTCTACRLA